MGITANNGTDNEYMAKPLLTWAQYVHTWNKVNQD